MSLCEKIKKLYDNIKQVNASYKLDRQTAKISALSSENVSQSEFLTGKDILPEKDLLKNAAAIKRLECCLLGE